MPRGLAALAALGLLLTGGSLLGQGAPLSPGQAPVTLSAPARAASGSTFAVRLKVDLSGRTGTCGGSAVPLVLGGYSVPVRFDPGAVVFVSAEGGESAPFSSIPAHTSPGFANANGVVLLNAIQGEQHAPSGLVDVAVLVFQATSLDGATLLAPEPGPVSLSSAMQDCPGGLAGPVSIPASGQPLTMSIGGSGFYPLAPCRVLDTRLSPYAPALAPWETRVFALSGLCGVDPGTVAVSMNLTVTEASASGELRAFAGDMAVPVASSLSFAAGRTRANNGLLGLSTDGAGTIAIRNDSPGSAHVILDVNGSFR